MKIIEGAEVDRRLAWPIGHAKRLAKQGALPHLLLPDGSIRFCWDDIALLVVGRLAKESGISTKALVQAGVKRATPDTGGQGDA